MTLSERIARAQRAERVDIPNRCPRHLDAQHAAGECGDTPGGPSLIVQSPFTRSALAGTLPPKDRTAY